MNIRISFKNVRICMVKKKEHIRISIAYHFISYVASNALNEMYIEREHQKWVIEKRLWTCKLKLRSSFAVSVNAHISKYTNMPSLQCPNIPSHAISQLFIIIICYMYPYLCLLSSVVQFHSFVLFCVYSTNVWLLYNCYIYKLTSRLVENKGRNFERSFCYFQESSKS